MDRKGRRAAVGKGRRADGARARGRGGAIPARLRDTLEGELVHQVDDERLVEELLLELLDSDWECRRVEQDLAVRRKEADALLDERLELRREELVSLRREAGPGEK